MKIVHWFRSIRRFNKIFAVLYFILGLVYIGGTIGSF